MKSKDESEPPLALAIDKETIGEQVIACPICGFAYTHVFAVKQISGGDHYLASAQVRGDVIRIPLAQSPDIYLFFS